MPRRRGFACTLLDWPGFSVSSRGPRGCGPEFNRGFHAHCHADCVRALVPAGAAVIAPGHAAAYALRLGHDRPRTWRHVVGCRAATVDGFRYSSALRGSGLTWDAETLDRFLAGPRALVPGTSKASPGIASDTDRADLVAYLQTLY